MFVKGLYLSVFCCLCYVADISIDMLEDQMEEERDPDLNEEEDSRLDAIGESIGGIFLRKVTIRRRLIP